MAARPESSAQEQGGGSVLFPPKEACSQTNMLEAKHSYNLNGKGIDMHSQACKPLGRGRLVSIVSKINQNSGVAG